MAEKVEKKRLDLLVFEAGYVPSREKAKAIIMAGLVYIDNQKADKPGVSYPVTAKLEVRGATPRYVSRGGYKLEKAMQSFPIDLKGKITMDIGASTGGFTDCMLQNGAEKVYSVDVGYGQLDWKLRNNPQVINLERTNIRYITEEQVPDKIDFFSVDVSFISLKLVLPPARLLMSDNATAVCLIKPQFEAGRENVGKKGVVRDPKVHQTVVETIVDFAVNNGFDVLGLDYSPIKGPEGNIEYLMYIRKSEQGELQLNISAEELVKNSHLALDKKD
ncbi:MAG: TlyA family RNA methyltransferase [Acutalibacteraceae bacterium]|nr:TlyA family RNA methyltransferase [Acutalibacteraceae bacterium]